MNVFPLVVSLLCSTLLQHRVGQVHPGTILHVMAAAVIRHSLSGLKCSLLCAHRGLLSVCDIQECVHVSVSLPVLFVCSLQEGQRRCRASMQAMPRARKQESENEREWMFACPV